MKKMWKLNNKAVSPVIATILMVAITVVLAAVLYVMVMGFGADTGQAPTASLSPSGNRLVISISEPVTNETGMALSLIINGTAYTFANYTENKWNVKFIDAGLDGKISTGDYFTRTSGPGNNKPVEIKLVWSSGGTNTIIAENEI